MVRLLVPDLGLVGVARTRHIAGSNAVTVRNSIDTDPAQC